MTRQNPPRGRSRSRPGSQSKPVTLKAVAEYLKLSPATVSVVLNKSPVADSIPSETKQRVIEAARKLKYRPNYLARSLRGKRTLTVGVLVPEISEGYASGVMSGIEIHLIREKYSYLMVSHRSKGDLLEEYLRLLEDRGMEGLILVAADVERAPGVPTVLVSGHRKLEGVSHVDIDHDSGSMLALSHLAELGHERIAFFRGPALNVDAPDRWRAVLRTAENYGIEVRPELTVQLTGESYGAVFSHEEGYQEGYTVGRELLQRGERFTALFAFNDISAIGAMRAFQDAGLRVPEDVSVVGFDDIQSAAFHNPSLTTVRQPLKEMGEIAARTLIARLSGDDTSPRSVTVEPRLVLRESTTAPARAPRPVASSQAAAEAR